MANIRIFGFYQRRVDLFIETIIFRALKMMINTTSSCRNVFDRQFCTRGFSIIRDVLLIQLFGRKKYHSWMLDAHLGRQSPRPSPLPHKDNVIISS